MSMFPKLPEPLFTSEEFEASLAQAVKEMKQLLVMEDEDGYV